MSLLITGATGFVGRALVEEARRRGIGLRAAVRGAAHRRDGIDRCEVGPVDDRTNWADALRGVDTVIHLAAHVHRMNGSAGVDIEYRRVNTLGTLRLAQAAAASGVRRFVFVSSVKVNGEGRARPYTESDAPDPQGPYAISKWHAEQGLRNLADAHGMTVAVLRPPLVYGPGVGANFRSLMHWIDRGWPLPLAAVQNRRSLVYVGNLVDAILACASRPAAANRTFLVSDGEDVATPELVARVAQALGRRPRLVRVPDAVLRSAGRLLGRTEAIDRLLGSLSVDSGVLRGALDWSPPMSLAQGLAATAAWYRSRS